MATRPEELSRLAELERRGWENGVPELRRLGRRDLQEVEPNARGLAALHSPQTGIVDFAAVARALAADVRRDGGDVATNCRVEAVERRPGARRSLRLRVTGGRRSEPAGRSSARVPGRTASPPPPAPAAIPASSPSAAPTSGSRVSAARSCEA